MNHNSSTSGHTQPNSQHQAAGLPDVALESSTHALAALPWVGMSRIEIPVLWGESLRIPSLVDAQVSLDLKQSRGIHMSRLYLSVQNILSQNKVSAKTLRLLTEDFLKTHEDLSSRARVVIDITLPLERKALKSANKGWRNYPVTLIAEQNKSDFNFFIEVRVTYSSTCPASAALSRQIVSQDFLKAFPQGGTVEAISAWLESTQGMPATPHAQRSEARILVQLKNDSKFSVEQLIDLIENTLQTPVQAAVKREDEQEFARRNSQNLMFCEDAARKVREALEEQMDVLDYYGQFQHFESLHPHNAVSFIQKKATGLGAFKGR